MSVCVHQQRGRKHKAAARVGVQTERQSTGVVPVLLHRLHVREDSVPAKIRPDQGRRLRPSDRGRGRRGIRRNRRNATVEYQAVKLVEVDNHSGSRLRGSWRGDCTDRLPSKAAQPCKKQEARENTRAAAHKAAEKRPAILTEQLCALGR